MSQYYCATIEYWVYILAKMSEIPHLADSLNGLDIQESIVILVMDYYMY